MRGYKLIKSEVKVFDGRGCVSACVCFKMNQLTFTSRHFFYGKLPIAPFEVRLYEEMHHGMLSQVENAQISAFFSFCIDECFICEHHQLERK